jgi:hypothetical protein
LQGFIARGCTTLLTSQWKAGKTTFLSMFLARRATGAPLAGLPVTPGKTAVVSEEPMSIWAGRIRQCGFGGNVCFFPQPFLSIPRPDEWQMLIDQIMAVHHSAGVDLVIIGPLAPFLRCESNAASMLETLLPLRALTRANMAVVLAHHPRKGAPPIGNAARGSGALLGHVDISIEMRHPGGDPLTRRRRFLALSRFTATPRQLLLELAADGTDYAPVADPLVDDFLASWNYVLMVLEDAPQKLSRFDILAEWPPDFDKPAPATLQRWLRRAVESRLVQCEGTGRKAHPYCYWLPETEARWREQNPLYDRCQEQLRELKLPYRSLQEMRRRDRGDDGTGLVGDNAGSDDDN